MRSAVSREEGGDLVHICRNLWELKNRWTINPSDYRDTPLFHLLPIVYKQSQLV